MSDYTPQERAAATIIASLIYPDYPSGPDLATDAVSCGEMWQHAIEACRDPYETAALLAQHTGKLYDSPAGAATAWEGLRQMTGTATNYAKIDPLVRAIGGEIEAMQQEAVRRAQRTMVGDMAGELRKNGKEPTKPRQSVEYVEAPEQPESTLLIEKLKILGYTFRLNLCSDTIEVNGIALDDLLMAELRMKLRDAGLPKKIKAAEDAYMYAARQDSYHPIRDYLDSLKWDGEDHIGMLTGHLDSSDPPVVYRSGDSMPLHHVYIYRWLIGAVAKIYTGCQNMMLVLDGPQGIGKSTLVFWLCPLPGFFLEGPINVADKDSDLRLLTNWIWEVSELDATTRKADQSAIKSFITKQTVTVRKSYGRHDIKKPAMCSLIGTVNDTSGFLADESGSRRFMITKIDYIDIAYQQLDVHQIWAQAVALYQQGQKGKLTQEEALHQARQNERYEVSTVLEDYIDTYCFFNPKADDPISIGRIVKELTIRGIHLSGSERSQAVEIARILYRRGARKRHTMHGNMWTGVGLMAMDNE